MKYIIKAIITILIISQATFAAIYKTNDGKMSLSAPTIEYMNYKIVAKSPAQINTSDVKKGTSVYAKADVMTVSFYTSSKSNSSSPFGSIKTAEFSGNVTITYITTDESGTKLSTVATAKKAMFSGNDSIMHLDGNVKIVHTNPNIFAEPLVLTGDKASVSLKSNLGPDDFRFKVEATEGVSRIEVIPIVQEDNL